MGRFATILAGVALSAVLVPATAADWPVRDDHDHTVPGSREERASKAYERYLRTMPLKQPARKARPGTAPANRARKAQAGR